MDYPKPAPAPSHRPGHPLGGSGAGISAQLLAKARADPDTLLKDLASRWEGLSQAEADARLKQVGPNEIAREKRPSLLKRLLNNVKNPLIILLVALGVLSYLTGDLRAMAVIFVMVLLGLVLRFFQELRADNAAERLKAMVSNTATVVRGGAETEMPLNLLVPGDIVRLAAGDMVPADVRLLAAKDLFLNQSALTGEALPVERKADPAPAGGENPLDLPNLCFLGSNVESGSATAVVIQTGDPAADQLLGHVFHRPDRQARQVHLHQRLFDRRLLPAIPFDDQRVQRRLAKAGHLQLDFSHPRLQLPRVMAGPTIRPFLAVLIASGVAQPIRLRIQQLVERVFYRVPHQRVQMRPDLRLVYPNRPIQLFALADRSFFCCLHV